MARSNSKLVPECRQMLKQWKYEIAAEFGLPVGGGVAGEASDTEFAGELGALGTSGVSGGSWRHLTSRENGSVGGEITKRLVAQAQRDLLLH
ncbi:alpha/beta-type small acid-soluble spore protein [Paenibacillus sp. FSL R5-0527]|uniref:alpha/beta-type small acid-soluble spore protein n=1 Tax=Paenibacillus TaxID=44249 RepID=UPI00097B6280|nr:alpha/beta-type small acid-soluble spore protein [Paenibacillus macerans]OMG49028.1 spore protein [Paenibacillus macerans]GBK65061.1 small acid-soluble spore protein [Paenibacillus macerans]GBK71354.1 small acid-soluble spore protein [Paenibacillus macerans]